MIFFGMVRCQKIALFAKMSVRDVNILTSLTKTWADREA